VGQRIPEKEIAKFQFVGEWKCFMNIIVL
jgi:hypothetical protein